MAPFYRDTSIIIDLAHLVEAHILNGTEQYDGMYLIICTLKIYEAVKEAGAVYKTEEARDKAFVVLGAMLAQEGART